MTITTMLFAIVGILSIYKPNIIGAEFHWTKYKWFYIPKYTVITNKFYEKYIKLVGIGFIVAAVVMFVVSIVYVFYPSII